VISLTLRISGREQQEGSLSHQISSRLGETDGAPLELSRTGPTTYETSIDLETGDFQTSQDTG